MRWQGVSERERERERERVKERFYRVEAWNDEVYSQGDVSALTNMYTTKENYQ